MYGVIEASQLRASVFCFKRYSGHVTCSNVFKLKRNRNGLISNCDQTE